MYYSTTDVYITKRKTVNFSKSLVPHRNKVETKFVAQLIYGMLKSGSVVLKDIGTALNETIHIKNTIDRLSRNSKQELSIDIQRNYLRKAINSLGEEPIILVDDTDIVKPYGKRFEALGEVRDGSSKGNKIEKGYLVTEIVGLTVSKKQPISLFSHIHSSKEQGYKSTNAVLFKGLKETKLCCSFN